MQVILLDDIANLGHEGEVVRVADGYARNYLIPKNMAAEATKGSLKELQQRGRAIAAREAHKRAEWAQLAERFKEVTILIRASVGEGGRLHGEVTQQNVADAVAEQLQVEIERRGIDIPISIRETGNYLITATIYQDIQVELPLRVIGSEEEIPGPEEEVAEVEEAAETDEQEAASGDLGSDGEDEVQAANRNEG